MKIPKWKHVLSYLFDIYICDISSEVNGSMKLLCSKGEYKLSTSKVVYSWGKHYQSFGSAFDKLSILNNKQIQSVLVLGWGMGSIATLLKHHISIKKIVGLDYDSALITFYEKEFQANLPIDIELHVADVFQFIANHEEQYDLICSDIFRDNITPNEIISKPYLTSLHKVLKTNGIALISKLNRTPYDREQNEKLEQNLVEMKIDAASIKSFGNSIYWWKKGLIVDLAYISKH